MRSYLPMRFYSINSKLELHHFRFVLQLVKEEEGINVLPYFKKICIFEVRALCNLNL